MKDTVITGKRKKMEILTLTVCFIIANLINLYAIVHYRTAYTEMLTSLGYVIVLTLALYLLWTVIRLIFYAVKRPKHL